MIDEPLALLDGRTEADEALANLMPAVGRALKCDRCVLFLREPMSRRSRATHAWQRRPEYALARPDRGWQLESPSLPDIDPMFAEALRNPEALFIEDVMTANSSLLNRDYELEHFGHRALVHAPLHHDGLLYGVLEPCVMAAPRCWSVAEREFVARLQARLAPLAVAYVARHCR